MGFEYHKLLIEEWLEREYIHFSASFSCEFFGELDSNTCPISIDRSRYIFDLRMTSKIFCPVSESLTHCFGRESYWSLYSEDTHIIIIARKEIKSDDRSEKYKAQNEEQNRKKYRYPP